MNEGFWNRITDVISTMDSFQQDHGLLRYSFTVQSYAVHHQITVMIVNTQNNKAIQFCVDETTDGHLYDLFEIKSNEVW